MLTYIYLVKCPHCEDEYFDFFDEAKQYALERISKQPIITQTEVTRNDFGECTDHCDLGTVWSWEEALGEPEKELDDTVFSKADTFNCPECDPEFDDLDNSIDHEIEEISDGADTINEYVDSTGKRINISNKGTNSTTQAITTAQPNQSVRATLDQLATKLGMFDIDESKFIRKGLIIRVPYSKEKMAYGNSFVYKDMFTNATGAIVKEILNKTGIDLRDCFSVNSLVPGAGAGNVKIWTYNDNTDIILVHFPNFNFIIDKNDFIAQLSNNTYNVSGQPIPEGMTIEELVEAMEENEDTVECAVCEELFPKTNGVKRGHSYVCPTCSKTDVDLAMANLVVDEFEAIDGYDDAEAVVANSDLPEDKQAEILDVIDHIREEEEEHIDELKELKTEDNTLSEDLSDTRSLEELVKDSINHLTNDLGKDPWADDFADDVIADLENNYDIYVPEDMAKYGNWCHSVASEVSRQVNRSEHASFLEELEEPEAYRERLCLCPECGTDKTFDKETGFCIECGFML